MQIKPKGRERESNYVAYNSFAEESSVKPNVKKHTHTSNNITSLVFTRWCNFTLQARSYYLPRDHFYRRHSGKRLTL